MLRLPEWVITHASESLQTIFGIEAQAAIGKPIDEIMSSQTIHRLRNTLQFVIANGEPERLTNLAMGYKRERFDLSLYADDGRAVIEIKPRQSEQKGTDDALFLLRAMRARLRSAMSPADVCARIARQARSLTGYDQVTVFQFHDDGSSEVVADERRSDGTSSVGSFYNADATDMLARNLVRDARLAYIPDTDYRPSAIIPAPVPQGGLKGLGALGLRSFAPEHMNFLQRSGIGAVFALPIGPSEAPWGVILCRNPEPRCVSFELRAAIEFFANGIAMQIGFLAGAEMLGTHVSARQARSDILMDPAMEVDPAKNLQEFADALGRHVRVDGVGYWNGDRFAGVGLCPTEEGIAALIVELDVAPIMVQTRDGLGIAGGPAGQFRGVGGVLAVRLSGDPSRYLMLFREEEKPAIRWQHANQFPDGGASREEVVAGHSSAWGHVEIEVGHALRSVILNIWLRRTDQDERERFATLRRQEFVISELNHRVKNLLALFQALVAKTGERSETLEDFVRDLGGRVRSLALAHDQINGSAVTVPIRSLIEAELAPFVSETRAFSINGPEIGLTSRASGVVAFVVHELATNAAKYGSLSQTHGRLDIHWLQGESGAIRLVWRELSETYLQSRPVRRGFGSTIVERMIPFELGGTADIRYLSRGLDATFEIPAEFVETLRADSIPTKRRHLRRESFGVGRRRRALVVEDNMIIALETEDMLRRLGFSKVDVAARRQDAEMFLAQSEFDIVALDITLGSETSFPIADQLADAGTPFVFTTGHGEQSSIPDRFAAVPIVAKPYSVASLGAALSEFFNGDG